MRIVLLSDTHEKHSKVEVPDGDVLIHAGDFTISGDYICVLDFTDWLAALPHKHKIVIAGNHELGWNAEKQYLLSRVCTFLSDSGCEIDSLKFWGSPFTPRYGPWAFMLPRGQSMYEKWLRIPHDTDVLITHGPPRHILDTATLGGENLGCTDLYCVLRGIKPRLHVFGHIHGGRGISKVDGTTFVNAACVDEAYQPVQQPPYVVDL